MSEQEKILNDLLATHDIYYEYADDMNAYSKGRDEKRAIIKHMIDNLSYDPTTAERYYNFITTRAMR